MNKQELSRPKPSSMIKTLGVLSIIHGGLLSAIHTVLLIDTDTDISEMVEDVENLIFVGEPVSGLLLIVSGTGLFYLKKWARNMSVGVALVAILNSSLFRYLVYRDLGWLMGRSDILELIITWVIVIIVPLFLISFLNTSSVKKQFMED